MKKALVAMSGGVDSSVAAYLMKQNGYETHGVTMLLHGEDAATKCGTHSCCTPDDIEDARIVASCLGIPFSVVNYMDEFQEAVIDKFIRTYLRGETPNPCIDCNIYMKFGRLFEVASKENFDKVVTGHYAGIEYDSEREVYRLRRARDRKKDQTYVLYFLNQEQLSRMAFPNWKYEKEEIRAIAEREGLPVADKHDSQDICFVPDGDYAGYIERQDGTFSIDSEEDSSDMDFIPRIPAGPGEFRDMSGKVLGMNKGYYHYTIGQRKGLGIAAEHPLYVVDIIPKENVVILGSNEDLFTRNVYAERFSLIEGDKAFNGEDEISFRVTAKVRYRAMDTPGTITVRRDGTAEMVFDDPVRAVTPGQSLVIYNNDYCLGGGIINRR